MQRQIWGGLRLCFLAGGVLVLYWVEYIGTGIEILIICSRYPTFLFASLPICIGTGIRKVAKEKGDFFAKALPPKKGSTLVVSSFYHLHGVS